MNMSIGHLWDTMPMFAKFIWLVLAIMSVWSLSTAIGKWWNLRKARRCRATFEEALDEELEPFTFDR